MFTMLWWWIDLSVCMKGSYRSWWGSEVLSILLNNVKTPFFLSWMCCHIKWGNWATIWSCYLPLISHTMRKLGHHDLVTSLILPLISHKMRKLGHCDLVTFLILLIDFLGAWRKPVYWLSCSLSLISLLNWLGRFSGSLLLPWTNSPRTV